MAEKPSDSPEKPPSETGKTEAAKPIALTPRQSAGSADRVSPLAAAPVAPVALNEQLMSALAQALTGQAAPAPPPVRDDRGLMSREEKRFRRGGPGLKTFSVLRGLRLQSHCHATGQIRQSSLPDSGEGSA